LRDPAAQILARIRAATSARVELYGSSVYAPAHAADIDAVVDGDDPARLAEVLGLALLPTTPPRLSGEIDGVSVDLTFTHERSGPRDAAALVAHLGARDAAFQAAWPHVRAFVKRRALGHNGLGWFGSFGWALLFATSLNDHDAGLAGFLRWLAKLPPNPRIELAGVRRGDLHFYLAAPSPPARDVAGLSKRAAEHLAGEARGAVVAIGDAATDDDAIARIADLADEPPRGTTLVVHGDDERGRGRYDGTARAMIRELEQLGNVRSWGRFDGDWEHRITVPNHRVDQARSTIEHHLLVNRIDAEVD